MERQSGEFKPSFLDFCSLFCSTSIPAPLLRALGASSPDLNSTALGGVNALRRISEDGAVACCFLQQLGLSPKGLYPCPRPFSSETPFSHCTMGRPSPGCLWVRGDHYLGRLVISVTSDASAAAEAGERDMRILPGQIPRLEPESSGLL